VLLDSEKKIRGMLLTREGVEEVVKWVNKFGVPSVIAVDTFKPSQLSKRLAAMFNCKVWTPNRDVFVKDKERLSPIKNRHLRDAHSAALLCYHHYENEIRKIKKKHGAQADKILHFIVKGFSEEEALKELRARESVVKVVKKQRRHDVNQLMRELMKLREENKRLRALLEGKRE
jgi:predicted RNase H-like nuclease (RuvC/YqgF family)